MMVQPGVPFSKPSFQGKLVMVSPAALTMLLAIVRAAMGVWVVADVFIMGATLRAPQRRLSNWAKLVEASNATTAKNINAFFILFVI